jgi:apolipoprotein D and lipocalin family protein
MKRSLKTVFFVFAVFLTACSSTPPNTNPHRDDPQTLASLDLPRYMGRWYNIAHIPYFGENGYVASYSEWTLRSDGQIDDLYAAKKGTFANPETRKTFVDTVEPDSGNARWSVHLFGPITVTQLTLYVDPQYQFTILGYPDKSLAWIFARSPDIDDKVYQDLLSKLDQRGYDISQMKRVPQHPDQLNQPGFQTP